MHFFLDDYYFFPQSANVFNTIISTGEASDNSALYTSKPTFTLLRHCVYNEREF